MTVEATREEEPLPMHWVKFTATCGCGERTWPVGVSVPQDRIPDLLAGLAQFGKCKQCGTAFAWPTDPAGYEPCEEPR